MLGCQSDVVVIFWGDIHLILCTTGKMPTGSSPSGAETATQMTIVEVSQDVKMIRHTVSENKFLKDFKILQQF